MVDATLKQKITTLLRSTFPDPTDRIGVFPAFGPNLHVLVRSARFSNLRESQKQDLLWDVLDTSLEPQGSIRVSLALGFAPSETEAETAFSEHEQAQVA